MQLSRHLGLELRREVLHDHDPLAFPVALMVLLGSAVIATVVPAWRATRVDPMEALRVE